MYDDLFIQISGGSYDVKEITSDAIRSFVSHSGFYINDDEAAHIFSMIARPVRETSSNDQANQEEAEEVGDKGTIQNEQSNGQ